MSSAIGKQARKQMFGKDGGPRLGLRKMMSNSNYANRPGVYGKSKAVKQAGKKASA